MDIHQHTLIGIVVSIVWFIYAIGLGKTIDYLIKRNEQLPGLMLLPTIFLWPIFLAPHGIRRLLRYVKERLAYYLRF